MHPTVYCMRKAAHSLSRIPMRRNGVVAGEFHMVKRLFGRPAERNSIWSLPHRVSPFVASNRFATGSFLREEGVIGDLHANEIITNEGEEDEALDLQSCVDLRSPHEWYPAARRIKRKIFLHTGPTNSGKTHRAMESLRKAESGLYCGPLRLLAFEIYERMNDHGVATNLVTGQQRFEKEGARHVACTVEMAEIDNPVDVAVIDEIQLIGCDARGWAWTRAVLGLPAKELHLCGNESVLDLISNIASTCNDDLEIIHYERLSPLHSASSPVTNFQQLAEGDCVVAFSRKEIYNIKRQVESQTHHKCCIVYGGLPPETRSTQAALFNDENSPYSILVASDAIGMGLNLNIKRVVLSTLEKFDGISQRQLTTAEIKQIAGRAGRYKGRYPDGTVACVSKSDHLTAKRALLDAVPQFHTAGLKPTFDQIERFATLMGYTRFSSLLKRFQSWAEVDKLYSLSLIDEIIDIAKSVDKIDLSLRDRYLFCLSPVGNNNLARAFFVKYVSMYASGKNSIPVGIDTTKIARKRSFSNEELQDLEALHNVVDLYLWLSFRFEPFDRVHDAEEQRQTLFTLIERGLENVDHRPSRSKRLFSGRHSDKRSQRANRRNTSPKQRRPKPRSRARQRYY